jgi:hypothetical protein
MIISVINLSNGALADQALLQAIRAINRQLNEDFAPYWGFGAQLRLEGKTGQKKNFDSADMRGDAILYVRALARIRDAEGFHEEHYSGIPYGFVFLELSKALKEEWSVTLSHEAMELIADPEANLLVQGPHPADRRRQVFHWYEMCDAVQSETYRIDGIRVSNFLLPLYFTSSNELGGRNDFLGTKTRGKTLESFGVNPGGYIGFYDPRIRGADKHTTFELADDSKAMRRQRTKAKLKTGRGNLRRRRTL